MLTHDLVQVAVHLSRVPFAGQRPVTQKGVVGHHRGDQDRPHQVLLDFRIHRIGGQRQFGVDDVVADRATRGEVTQQGRRQKAAGEQQQ
ncbi:hypothetical protein D3C77_637330 [compost metagenome]